MNIRDKLSLEHEKYLRWSISNRYHIPATTPTQIVEDLESVGLVVDGFQLTEMGRYVAWILDQNHRLKDTVNYLQISLKDINDSI